MSICYLKVHVILHSRKPELLEYLKDGTLKVRLKAMPIKGRANKELIEYLSSTLGISRSNIEIRTGKTSKNKLLKISGLDKLSTIERIQNNLSNRRK